MLHVFQESNRFRVSYNTTPLLAHTPWKPCIQLSIVENGKKRFVRAKHLTASQIDSCHVVISCPKLIEMTITEADNILQFSYTYLPAQAEVLSISLHIEKRFYIITFNRKHKNLIHYNNRAVLPGPYLYGTHGFIAGVKKGILKAKKIFNRITLQTQREGFIIAQTDNFYESASSVHRAINHQQTRQFPSCGIYFMGGGGDIALSCKVQALLDAHIPSHGIIVSDLFSKRAASMVPWDSAYPDLQGEIHCYKQAGMTPCVMLNIGYDSNDNKQTATHYSHEQLEALKAAGIDYLGFQHDPGVPLYSLQKLTEYAVTGAKQSNFSIGFSYVQSLPIHNTYQLYVIVPSETTTKRISTLCRASYGAYGVCVPIITLRENYWKNMEDFYNALEFALFSPSLVLDFGTDSHRTIPLVKTPLLRALISMLELYTMLMPYHEFCINKYVHDKAPVHYMPVFTKKPASIQTFMYGQDLLIGLQINHHQDRFELELPPGTWIHFWTGISYEKGSIVINAPASYPAVFYKAGSKFTDLFDTIRRTRKNA